MKNKLFKLVMKALYWLIYRRGTQLKSADLVKAGWIVDVHSGRLFYVEPNIKVRDKVWIEFENHYYRVYHGEHRTFVSLETKKEWLQGYLFLLDYHQEVDTRKFLK